ncbi:TetR family transcriptional regulator [Pseudonocardia sediminis]|uniref:TetR family transcriptional regulator n=1 Tax=Pseudonocardia sediminis TaxID=1397368 RepID=A0A4Q7URC7_PSEST|nr:TetR/AcrR family transcriptional regulator [Pseudonocardia sediminis]RZT84252.1 TetR family transcriptional regulator [Pseudonocardia sediminis]
MARRASAQVSDDGARPDSKSARTRERILDAAAEVLNRNGYAGTRLSDIAEIAQLQAPAIYYYFPSRDDVIQEVVQVGLRRTMAHVEVSLAAMPADATGMERILTAVAAHLEVVLQDSAYSAAAIRNAAQLPTEIREVQLVDQRRYGDLWRSLIDDAVAAGEIEPRLDPGAARMLVIGALNWAPEWWREERGSLADTVRTAQLLVRRGLGTGSD